MRKFQEITKGQKSKFLKLIKSAVINGADMVKIQTYSPEDITMNKKEPKFMIKDGIFIKKIFVGSV